MIDCIENIDKLAAALGDDNFYDFHDAEIVSLKFDREDSVTLEVTLQIHRRIGEFESAGKMFDRFRNFDAVFKFDKVWLLHLLGFGHLNVIQKLIIEREQEKFIVRFKKIYGCDLKFECEKMTFQGVRIFETEKARFIPDIEKIRAGLAAKKREHNEN